MLLSSLVHTGTEFFNGDNNLHYQINAGKIEVIEQIPSDYADLLFAELKQDPSAVRSLAKMGITEEKAMVEQYFDCNYSAFGGDADLNNNGKLGEREVVPCTHRDTCPFEGKLCKLPAGLTKREAQIARAITKAMMDAEITATLFISQNTLRNHKNNIENKIGQTGKIAIGVWAKQIGLI